MKCPSCSGIRSFVRRTNSAEDLTMIRRDRECLSCGEIFKTFEAPVEPDVSRALTKVDPLDLQMALLLLRRRERGPLKRE